MVLPSSHVLYYMCYMNDQRRAVSHSCVVELSCRQSTDLRAASAMLRGRAFECSRFLCLLAYQNFEYFSIVQQIKVSLIWTSREISDLPKYFYIEHIFIYTKVCVPCRAQRMNLPTGVAAVGQIHNIGLKYVCLYCIIIFFRFLFSFLVYYRKYK